MTGLQAPSSSRTRRRPSPIAAGVAADAENGGSAPSTPPPQVGPPAPPESIVVRSGGSDRPSRTNTNGSGGGGGDDSGENVQNTNVRVCVRLRPLLASDFKNADHLSATDAAAPPTAAPSPDPGGGGSRFARGTASSHGRRSSALKPPSSPTKRHASGLVTPAKREPAAAPQQLQQLQQLQRPSWIARDQTRIVQAAHTVGSTSHQDAERLADYTFDRVYGPSEGTDALYDESIEGVVGAVVEGYHGSVFAYGQTNSGKTHTMSGSPSEPGVVRRAVRDVFHRIRSQSTASSSREYLVRVSYLEIYNEQIYDLLALPQASPGRRFGGGGGGHALPPSAGVRIFESKTEGVQVRGLREEIVTRPEDVFALLDDGDARRRTGSTGMNRTSSRSHSVFRLVLESRASRGGGGGVPPPASSGSSVASDGDSVGTGRSGGARSMGRGPVRVSSLSLVDLAGSESAKATGSTGVRRKEGQYINKSLLTLGHVVHKLSEMGAREARSAAAAGGGGGGGGVAPPAPAPPREHIPYRDSKLTRLLQPSLGGNARVCVVCNVSPALANLEETHNTLKFATRAKRIKQRARITEVADDKTLLRSYREEIEELKRQLREAKKAADEARSARPPRRPRGAEEGPSSDDEDEDDQDDKHVLVSAIANLESLILKAGGKSARKAGGGDPNGEGEEALPGRDLDAALRKAESEETNGELGTLEGPEEVGSPTTGLLEELHRIQGMLGSVAKRKRRGGGGGTTPARDAEVERLRSQLREEEVTSAMRRADSSFLQGQLNQKDGLLKEVSVLLEALEKRQLELEKENERLKEDLAEAAGAIEEGVAARKELEDRLAQRDAQLAEKKCIVFVEKSTSTAMTAPEEEHIGDVDASLAMPPPPPRDEVPATTVELATLPGSSSPSASNPTGLLKAERIVLPVGNA